ncbi:hypothetical protein EJB05_13386 [Eragrostis curvula]|uniref:Uncharacterized protein n=1 Tax=Eragrostis curvula TaxID=38414 RepID=A0A5J9VU48_9POAL|nr:hypothetical protein EJB05_13386 [Eragrostis curvula]
MPSAVAHEAVSNGPCIISANLITAFSAMARILAKLKLLTSPIWETVRPCLGTLACSSATTNPTVGGGGREWESLRGRLPLSVDGEENPRRRDVICGRSGGGNNEEEVNRETERRCKESAWKDERESVL